MSLDLTGFVPIPGQPGYLVDPAGRVASLKKVSPSLLKVRYPRRMQLATVRIGGTDIRVRDLVSIVFGPQGRWSPEPDECDCCGGTHEGEVSA